ncbi:hypothetical protein KA078_00940 [Candidatus Woesebacteria bacterium]|nr:hypothetical protein [Candidatus Woesebacteria bacterium]
MGNMDNPNYLEQQAGEPTVEERFAIFYSALKDEITRKGDSGVGNLLKLFNDLCPPDKLTRSFGAAINSSEAQPLAVLMVDHFITDGREKIIIDTAATLQSLFDRISIKIGEAKYSLNQFMIATVNGGEGHQDSSISVSFVLPGEIRDKLKEPAAAVAAAPQLKQQPQPQHAELQAASLEATVDRNANKNAVFAEMLPQLLIGVDPKLAELIKQAVQRTPGSGNIYVELPVGMNKKEVRKQLNDRFGAVAFAQNYDEGVNAIQITVNNLSQ